MSKTIAGAFLQFLVTMGIITTSEVSQLADAVLAVIAIIPLLFTIYGRLVTTGDKVSWLGLRK